MTKQGSKPGDTTVTTRRRAALSGIEQRVLKRLKALNLGQTPRMVVGFSGGVDSLCLAAIVARLARGRHVDPLLAHVNHRLRPSADDDADTSARLASEIRLPISISAIEGSLSEKHPGVGIEEAARRERYLLLSQAAVDFGSRVMAVAHHQSDQAETVRLHLFRGAGLTGVAGMAELTAIEVPWWDVQSPHQEFVVWRPLLTESKDEIDRYVADLGLMPIVDESNADLAFRRNAIRHTILPAIERFFPAAKVAISSFAQIAGEEDELLDAISYESIVQAGLIDGRLTRSLLMSVPVSIQRRIVIMWLEQWISSEAIGLDRVDAVLELTALNRRRKMIEVGENISVELIGDELIARSSAS